MTKILLALLFAPTLAHAGGTAVAEQNAVFSTIDYDTATGFDIPIEERDTREVTTCSARPRSPRMA